MTQPCHHEPTLTRIEDKVDKIADALTTMAVQQNEINHLKEAVKPIPELVAWKNKWGGAAVMLSMLATLFSVLAVVAKFS